MEVNQATRRYNRAVRGKRIKRLFTQLLKLLIVIGMVTTARAYAAPHPAPLPVQEEVRPAEVEKPKPEAEKPKPSRKKAKPQPSKQKAVVPYKVTGNKETWLRQAGIPASQWKYVDYIVSKESGWNPLAVNKSSGACSLVQSLPCSKIPGDWRNPVNALKWQYKYVTERYGGYAQAYAFWVANQWY